MSAEGGDGGAFVGKCNAWLLPLAVCPDNVVDAETELGDERDGAGVEEGLRDTPNWNGVSDI